MNDISQPRKRFGWLRFAFAAFVVLLLGWLLFGNSSVTTVDPGGETRGTAAEMAPTEALKRLPGGTQPPVADRAPDRPPPSTRLLSPVRLTSDMTRPEKISGPNPQYTEIARKARIQGVVIVEAIIDQTGAVANVRILKPLPMGLDQAAVEAVKQWRFTPATRKGEPVAVYYNLTMNFRLQ